ncbi:MAG: gamma-glutamylcyclotransferase family protein, partial [Vicinamibacteria bacterium]
MEIFLVGYGTLLHRGSLDRSIGRESADRKRILPVLVRGYRRLFNLRPTHYATSFKLSREPIENAAMNVEPAAAERFNGLGFEATPEELAALDERERYYRRKTAPVFHFDSGELIGEGHFYVSDPDASWIARDVAKLMPLWRDVVWARAGAYRVGETFGHCYDETTY